MTFFYELIFKKIYSIIKQIWGVTMLVYGKNVLKETDAKMIRKVYLVTGFRDEQIYSILKDQQIRYEFITRERMEQMVKGNHQGIVLDIHEYQYASLADCFLTDFVLVLDHLEDPHNLGAIIRSAEAAGIHYIILPKDRSVRVNDTVMKISAGALNRVSIILVANIAETLRILKEKGFFIFASAMDGESYRHFNYNLKKVLVIGSEGKGIRSITRKNSDAIIKIPMKGQINSLNASVAAGILMFQMIGE